MKPNTRASRLVYVIAFAITILSIQGCAIIFSSRYQKVNFQNSTTAAKIKYPATRCKGQGEKRKFDKFAVFHTVNVEKEGYKSYHYPFQVNKRSPTIAFTVLNLAIPFYGWFYGFPLDFTSPKTRKFDKDQKIPKLVAYEKRKADEKYVLINNTAFDAKGSDVIWHDYLSIPSFYDNDTKDGRSTKKHNKSKDRDDIKIDNTIFTSALNGTMKEMNFIDTTHSVFPSIKNSIYLNATVKKITFHHLRSRVTRSVRLAAGYKPNTLLCVEMTINWEVLDYYKQKVDSIKTTKKSDLFTVAYDITGKEVSQLITDLVGDNLEYSLLEVRKSLSEKGLLKINSGTVETKEAAITIAKPSLATGSRMNDFMKSGVTLKVDDGHGSGVIISDDGYILTAYHVIAGSKTIEVIFNDGTKAEAKVIRSSTESDLALIKVTNTGLLPLPLNMTEPEIGIDVWAIGTPKSVELGQSVSKGILSGLRKANEVSYLQTDVSLNGGNSGGALITKEGTVLGIVTSKLVGVGTEGVGFAISAQEVLNRLNISYK